VLAARSLPNVTLPQAIHDDVAGAAMIATHFHQLGHRRVAQLRGPDAVSSFARRTQGFSATCRELGMTEIQIDEFSSSLGIEEGERLLEALLRHADPLPTAIFAHNDQMAVGALVGLRRAGLSVPDDISLAGYNDIPMVEHISPPLTTVNSRSFEVGEAAGAMIFEYIAGRRPSDRHFDPILVPRASTAPPRP
jgi:LacI family transcriptional regulator